MHCYEISRNVMDIFRSCHQHYPKLFNFTVNPMRIASKSPKPRRFVRASAEKPKNEGKNIIRGIISSRLPYQIATGIFALGFIDAGYSGDWSRIGVISKENEELLRNVSYFVVPMSLWLIISLSKAKEQN